MNVYICEMENEKRDRILEWHVRSAEGRTFGRRLTLAEIEPILIGLDSSLFKVSQIGLSHEQRPLYRVDFGSGETRILIWTQMHGNESTGTRAVLDLFDWVQQPGDLEGMRDDLLQGSSISVLPMLNPDGAEAYTRVNAQQIDLNRDVLEKKAPESEVLQQQLSLIHPDFCFNMHDQRTIFSVGEPPRTATVSFLAPSEDEARTVTEGRIKTMKVISGIFESLKEVIPGHIGRYTDEFYPSATGDNFQRMGYPTVLIESGHSQGDYLRQVSRRMTFLSLVLAWHGIVMNPTSDHGAYFDIPNNEQRYLDGIVKNVSIDGVKADIGVFLKEELQAGKVCFRPTIEKFEDLSSYSADRILTGDHLRFTSREDAEKWLSIEFN